MGVRKLNKFLSDKQLIKEYSNLTRFVNNNKKHNKLQTIVLGIDFWLYAHKFSYSYKNMLIGFWNQIVKLLSHRIIPLYIYDGHAPDEKNNILKARQKKKVNLENKLKAVCDEISNIMSPIETDDTINEQDSTDIDHLDDLTKQKRQLQKSIIHIKKADIDNVRNFFSLLNIPCLDATGEADSLCAKLYKDGYITACLSDDMDMLALGCGKTIKFFEGKVYEYDLDHILHNLQLTHEEFIEMCILFGCDYIKPNFKLEIDDSYELIKEYSSIDKIVESCAHPILNKNNDKCKNFVSNYKNAKTIFLTSCYNENIPHDFHPSIDSEINPKIVIKYLLEHGQKKYIDENLNRVFDSIDYINNHINNMMLYNSKNKIGIH
jgi:5'-3' exonuclease